MGGPYVLDGTVVLNGFELGAVADAFDAMTVDRVYRPALPVQAAWEELRRHAGTQFDPEIVEAFSIIAADGPAAERRASEAMST